MMAVDDEPHLAWRPGYDEDARGFEPLEDFGVGESGIGMVGVDDVGFNARKIDAHARDVVELLRQQPRVGVVFGEAVDHLFEGDDSGGGDDAGLTHAASEPLADPAGAVDEVAFADEDRTEGAAQSLGQAEHHGVDVAGVLGGRDSGGDGGVEDARAVEMDREIVLAGDRAELAMQIERDDAAAAAVVGVLQTEQTRAGMVNVPTADSDGTTLTPLSPVELSR